MRGTDPHKPSSRERTCLGAQSHAELNRAGKRDCQHRFLRRMDYLTSQHKSRARWKEGGTREISRFEF